MTRPPSQTLGVRVPTETKREFEALCKARGTTASEQVRAWVEYTVAEEQLRAGTREASPAGESGDGTTSASTEAEVGRQEAATVSKPAGTGRIRVKVTLVFEEFEAVMQDCRRLRMTRNDWLVRAVRSMLLKRPEMTREEMVMLGTMMGDVVRLNSHLDNVIPLPNPDTGEARMAVLDANLLEASRLVGRQLQDALNKVLSQVRHRWLDP